MGRPVPIRQVNNITDCVDDYDDDVVKSILEMNTSSKSVVGFRSYNDTNEDVDKSSITANDEGQVTTTPAATAATATPERVLNHYRNMRTYQTVEFHTRMMEKYTFNNGIYRRLMTIEEAFVELENYIDASDPDMDLPNLLHLLQTAEGIRQANQPDWFQLVGLIHDMGKIMFLWGTSDDGQDGYSPFGQQWSLGGDTFVVGCRIPDEAVILPQYNTLNPDMSNPAYNTEYGMYEAHCGLDALKFAWGHDEYMYQMLIANDCSIPKVGLDMIRYHSAYPWHDKNAYRHLMKPDDYERILWVKLFNKFDLYTKDTGNELRGEKMQEELWPYYKGLLDKYGLGGKLKW